MATTDLGLVRDKITEVRKISENGTSATYAIMTEMNNTGTGAGTFTVKNGGNIAISEVFNSISDLVNGIKQCGANHIGEIVAIFYQSSSYAWQEVQPNYLFATADTTDIAQLNGLSLYSVSGNLLSSGNFAFAYYAQEVESTNEKIDGHFEYNDFGSIAEMLLSSESVSGALVGKVTNVNDDTEDGLYIVSHTRNSRTGNHSYKFIGESFSGAGIRISTSTTPTFHKIIQGVIDIGSYATTNDALTAIQDAIYGNSSAFENGEKYVAQNSSETIITVVGCSGTYNRILIGYVSDFTGEDDAYFFAAEPAANDTWNIVKYGIDNSPKNIGTTPLYDIDVRSLIRSATSGTIDMLASFRIFDGGNFYVCSFYCSGSHPTVSTAYDITLNFSLPNNNWICVAPERISIGQTLLASAAPHQVNGSFISMKDAEISFATNTNYAQGFKVRLTVNAMGASGGSYFGGMFMLPKFDALN